MSDDFISRLLAGPDDVELSPRDLALLEACLQHPEAISATLSVLDLLQPHLAMPLGVLAGEKPFKPLSQQQLAKLRMIRDFNRGLQGQGGADKPEKREAPAPSSGTHPGEEEKPPADADGDRPGRDPNKPSRDRQNDILAAIRAAGVPLTRPELIDAMKLKTEGKLGANLAWMVTNRILINIPQRGYWPAGEPVPE